MSVNRKQFDKAKPVHRRRLDSHSTTVRVAERNRYRIEPIPTLNWLSATGIFKLAVMRSARRVQILDGITEADDEDYDSVGKSSSGESLDRADSPSTSVSGPHVGRLLNEVILDRLVGQLDIPPSSPGQDRPPPLRRLLSTVAIDAEAASELNYARTTPVQSPIGGALCMESGPALLSSNSERAFTDGNHRRWISVMPSVNDGHNPAEVAQGSSSQDAIWCDRAKSSVSSVAALVGLNKRELTELFNNKQASGAVMLSKMLVVVGLPAATLVVFTSFLLWNAVSTQAVSRLAIDDLRRFLAVDDLVTNIQV